MNQGYFIAQREPDGSPGKPIGNEDGAIMLFDSKEQAQKVLDEMTKDVTDLRLYMVNYVVVGEVTL